MHTQYNQKNPFEDLVDFIKDERIRDSNFGQKLHHRTQRVMKIARLDLSDKNNRTKAKSLVFELFIDILKSLFQEPEMKSQILWKMLSLIKEIINSKHKNTDEKIQALSKKDVS